MLGLILYGKPMAKKKDIKKLTSVAKSKLLIMAINDIEVDNDSSLCYLFKQIKGIKEKCKEKKMSNLQINEALRRYIFED